MLVKSNNLGNGIFTFFKYCLAAKKVPVKDGIFREPMTLEMGSCDNKIIPAGVCMSPPPPTMASTNPATNAMQHKIITVELIAEIRIGVRWVYWGLAKY